MTSYNAQENVEGVYDGGFDEDCYTPEVGVKAVWLLYRWGKWTLLNKLGLERDVERSFEQFDDEHIPNEQSRISSAEQVAELIQKVPQVLNAAIELAGMYMLAKKSSIIERCKQ